MSPCIFSVLSSNNPKKTKKQKNNFQRTIKLAKSSASVARKKLWILKLNTEPSKSSKLLSSISIMIACNGGPQENTQLSKVSKRIYSSIYCMKSVKKNIWFIWHQAFQLKRLLRVLQHTLISAKKRNLISKQVQWNFTRDILTSSSICSNDRESELLIPSYKQQLSLLSYTRINF